MTERFVYDRRAGRTVVFTGPHGHEVSMPFELWEQAGEPRELLVTISALS